MMSNEEEKRCPLCAEELDWTDQQFQPCKCGYKICVWCWHHIIDMAEKEETEGRCPACRTIYEKEKIVAMQTNCEKTMTKISNRKTKPPKPKPKTNEVKKDLTNVRVIQRKMAYVIGLPLCLADEDVLVRKEYFGQYGKVTKISLSRTAGGAIQQFINDTCSVYITYSKEEEALRCIQSVHGFFLEGRLLRASFGTAKYCHAWLKNMPCNNSACLYLHSIGSDEDSFGKDEVAAVHTRGRVQQIVGATNNMVKRSGNVLPPPVDEIHYSSSIFTDKSTLGSATSDTVHGSANSDIPCQLPHKEKEGAVTVPHKMTTFVDIVGRSNSAVPERDGSIPSEPLREDSLLSDNQGSIDAYGSNPRSFFLRPSYPTSISDDSGGMTLLQQKAHSMNGFAMGLNPVHNHHDEASLSIDSGLSDSFQEMKFRNSAKSDRIYRNSNSFSNEEIVEHLRRIDDDNSTNDKEKSVLDAIESSIISNIMSIDLDSCEDSLTMPNGLSGGSSWSSLNSDQSGYSYVKRDGFASQMPGSIFSEYTDNKEQYSYKPQYPVNRAQILAPPGFSMPSRDPPPGFSTSERTSSLPRASSGTRLANLSSFSTPSLQPSSTRLISSMDDVDFFDPTISSRDKGKRTNGFINPSFETRPTDESRLWLLMQQSASAHHFAPQTTHIGNGLAELDEVYGSSSRLVDERQNYDPSFFTQISQQKFTNGHPSNTNGYRRSFDEGQHNGEMGIKELQRNERLGVNNYFPGYGDLMFSSGDVYTRVFGL